MVKIRLFKTGTKKKTSYRVIAIDSLKKRNGQPLEILGYYDPKTKPATIKIDQKRLVYWQDHGAQITPAVATLLK